MATSASVLDAKLTGGAGRSARIGMMVFGVAAEITAMFTIGPADWFGMPASTTHVLSSGVAGTMATNHI